MLNKMVLIRNLLIMFWLKAAVLINNSVLLLYHLKVKVLNAGISVC